MGSRTTAADQINDVKSTDRKLENTLVLLTEQQIGTKQHFILPQGKRNEGETLRQTAERVLKTSCGNSLNVHFWGNAPIAFYKYNYPTEQNESIGAKIFFFRAIYNSGNVDQKLCKFEWLDKDEALDKLKNYRKYIRSVKPLLL